MNSMMVARGIQELRLAGLFDSGSDYDGALGKAIQELLETFAAQEHSGYSALITADIFHRLVKGDILTPLTSNPMEWRKVDDDLWQNTRKFSCFSSDGGLTWYDHNDCSYTVKDGETTYTTNTIKTVKDPRNIIDWPKCNTCSIRHTCDRREFGLDND